jgi:hypothetical protein
MKYYFIYVVIRLSGKIHIPCRKSIKQLIIKEKGVKRVSKRLKKQEKKEKMKIAIYI